MVTPRRGLSTMAEAKAWGENAMCNKEASEGVPRELFMLREMRTR